MPCHHREDVCQHCLEKVQTTTEDSPPKDTLPLGSKIILFPIFFYFTAASGYLWVETSKVFFKAAKETWKLIGTPTE